MSKQPKRNKGKKKKYTSNDDEKKRFEKEE